jgi:uracil-DNA glycosylase family 4
MVIPSMPVPPRALARLDRELATCRQCPRLAHWREQVAITKRHDLLHCDYHARPVPSFGPANARVLVVGLAPGAHGANRTGRPFTGDGAGPFLYGALHRAGFATRPTSLARDDGLVLRRLRITNAVRCVPPGNRPTPQEIATCLPYLVRELAALRELRCVLCLGAIAFAATLRACTQAYALTPPRPRPRFAHGVEVDLGASAPRLFGAYHPSQLNTRTGRLTPAMFDRVLARVSTLVR